MHSEEVIKLNVALKYCDLLKNNLQASILHVQMLNRKYNTKEYIQPLHKIITDSPRKNISLQRNSHQSQIQKTPTRSLKDVERNFNNIIVNGIKVQREVETVVTQLKLLGKDNRVEQPFIIKRKMQSANYSFTNSPTERRHHRCCHNLSERLGSRDRSQSRPHSHSHSHKKKHYSFIANSNMQDTPKRKRPAQLLRGVLVKGKTDFDVNEISFNTPIKDNGLAYNSANEINFQSTPIKDNGLASNSAWNSSSFLSDSIEHIIDLPNTSTLFIDDKVNSTTNAAAVTKTCFRNNSNSPKREQLYDTPKRICWTPILKVKKISIYQ